MKIEFQIGVKGGVLSCLMRLLLINELPGRVRGLVGQTAPIINVGEDFLLQVFADDISMAIKGNRALDVSEAANQLARIFYMARKQIGLTLSSEKCKNFLIQAGPNALRLFKRGGPTSRWF